ncbi:hypothetical protein CLV58_10630 [Spirosoma oryzae]|uniref:Uncharacterized protein n=1 Tax=Spirosoma oryzae TaxID=1469603 RepID=A0A2T0T5A4_9BACT|nr:hypothetical protein [Spirosoma oryzae]PRY40847.1 hypothetical protein CLV58_10630 [Spirosoma oryzae]
MQDQLVTPELSRQRLLAIADHLDKPQAELMNNVFDFTSVIETHGCGTLGCALGEYPVIFPDHFEVKKHNGSLHIVAKGSDTSIWSVNRKFLGIPDSAEDLLFCPNPDRQAEYDGEDMDEDISDFVYLFNEGVKGLPGYATKEQVAANIRRYVMAFLPEQEQAV